MDCIKCSITELCKYRAYAVNVKKRIKEIETPELPFIITMRCQYYLDELRRKELAQMEKVKQANRDLI